MSVNASPLFAVSSKSGGVKDSVMFDVSQLGGVVNGKDGGDKDFMILNS